MFITYEEYEELGFQEVKESDFKRLERMARRFLQYYTQNRIDDIITSDYEEDIKECMAMLVNNEMKREVALKDLDKGLEVSRLGIASEKVTDHSITYSKQKEASIEDTHKNFDKIAAAIVRRYLLWTGVLYRGL